MISLVAAVFALAASCGIAVAAGISSKAEALRVEAATGNPLHIVREGQGEKPVLAIRNAAQERISAHGTLKVEGFRGDAFDLPVDIALDAGEAVEIPMWDGRAVSIPGRSDADCAASGWSPVLPWRCPDAPASSWSTTAIPA